MQMITIPLTLLAGSLRHQKFNYLKITSFQILLTITQTKSKQKKLSMLIAITSPCRKK